MTRCCALPVGGAHGMRSRDADMGAHIIVPILSAIKLLPSIHVILNIFVHACSFPLRKIPRAILVFISGVKQINQVLK